MAKVQFKPAGLIVENVKPGTQLIDITDEHPDSGVPFSCRSASCGSCRVRVEKGAEALAKPEDDELDVLEIFNDSKDVRLCCQMKLETETDELVISVMDPL